jgi:quinol monooxygenase YgiN
MDTSRRQFAAMVGGAIVAPGALIRPQTGRGASMFGLIGKMTAVAGQRDALIAILVDGVGGMPGCLSYVVARDPSDEDALWITEVWDSQASHKASLSLPAVQQAIAKGRPLIARFDQSIPTEPVGGFGLPSAPREA